MYKKYLRRRGPARRKAKPIKRAIKAAKNKMFKKRVLKVLHEQNESKAAFLTTSYVNYNSAISGLADASRIIPNIAVGSADNQRIGDQIRAQKLKLDMILQFPPIVSTTLFNSPGLGRIGVRVLVVTPKSYPNWASASTAPSDWTQWLLKKGGTTSGFNGNVEDLYAPVNTDAITKHFDKVFYMNQPYVLHNGSTTDVAINQAGITRHVKKTFNMKNALLKYDANVDSGLTPVNKGMFLLIGYAYTDGSTAPDILTTRVRNQYTSSFIYEDA